MNYYSANSNMHTTEQTENTDNRSGLFAASRICGLISMTLGIFAVTTCCLGYLSIPIGALGILFAMLSRRYGQPMPASCKTGLMLSVAGLVIGCILMILHIYTTITNPTFWEYMQEVMEMYEEVYGIEMNL